MANPIETNLQKNPANFQSLTPLSFIERTAATYPDRTAVIHGNIRRTWAETYSRSRRLASALERHGLKPGETVAAMLPNVPAMVEAHFGVSMMGGVLNALNIRLDDDAIAFILQHGEAKVLLTDREFSETIKGALAQLDDKPFVIDVDDVTYEGGELLGEVEYEDFIAAGDPEYDWEWPTDEWNACSLNYTSGNRQSEGRRLSSPRCVFERHRQRAGLGNASHPIYLWTLPMFHCNGWCFPRTVAAFAGTNVCLRRVEAEPIFDAISEHGVTHSCGAPIVLNMIANAPDSQKKPFDHTVEAMTAGAAPPAAVIESMESQGFNVTHVYGLTETYGPSVVSA